MGAVENAVAAIRAGEAVILPTDTVYGLCASPHREDPVARIYQLKGRPETTPTALVASDVDTLLELMPELNGRPAALARALLPGAFTLVLPNPKRRFRWLTGVARGTIGVRVPVLEGPAREVLAQVGVVAATSANRHRGLDPSRLDDVPTEIRGACGAEIDGGELPGVPSTVVDLSGPEPRILREGVVPAADALARISSVEA